MARPVVTVTNLIFSPRRTPVSRAGRTNGFEAGEKHPGSEDDHPRGPQET